MTITNVLDVAPAPSAKADRAAQTTPDGSDFSAELDKAGQAQESTKKPEKTDNPDQADNLDQAVQEGEEPTAKVPVEEEKPAAQESEVAAMVIPVVIPQIQAQETVQTQAEGQEATAPVAQQPVVDMELPQEKAVVDPGSPKETGVTNATQDKPEASASKMGTTTLPETAGTQGTEFAKQVLKEANAVLEKQQGADAQKPVTQEVRMEAPAKGGTLNQQDGEQEKADAKSNAPITQTTHTAQVADDGKVEFKLANAQMPEAPEVRQKDGESMLTRLIDQVRSTVSKEKTEFFLQLKPEHLGGLSIMLSAEEKGVVAKLMTSNQDVQNMLQSDMNQLQAALREKGINVVHMEVIYDQTANSTAKDHSDGKQQQQGTTGNGHGRIPEELEGASAYYDTISYYEALAEQGGSVEFSA